jgi:hypothetical protein
MQMLKTLWAAVQEDPKLMRRLNGWLTIFWIAMIPVSIVMGWVTRSSGGRSSRVQALQLLARPRPDDGRPALHAPSRTANRELPRTLTDGREPLSGAPRRLSRRRMRKATCRRGAAEEASRQKGFRSQGSCEPAGQASALIGPGDSRASRSEKPKPRTRPIVSRCRPTRQHAFLAQGGHLAPAHSHSRAISQRDGQAGSHTHVRGASKQRHPFRC